MTDAPQKQPAVPFRILSMEGLFGAFGLFSLATGLWNGDLMPAFWGTVILAGLALLAVVRRRDWQKHWDAMAREQLRNPPSADEPRNG